MTVIKLNLLILGWQTFYKPKDRRPWLEMSGMHRGMRILDFRLQKTILRDWFTVFTTSLMVIFHGKIVQHKK